MYHYLDPFPTLSRRSITESVKQSIGLTIFRRRFLDGLFAGDGRGRYFDFRHFINDNLIAFEKVRSEKSLSIILGFLDSNKYRRDILFHCSLRERGESYYFLLSRIGFVVALILRDVESVIQRASLASSSSVCVCVCVWREERSCKMRNG